MNHFRRILYKFPALRSRANLAAAVMAVAALSLPLCSQAQGNAAANQISSPSAPASIRTTTELVLVPAVVSDKHGNHIPHLTKDDFQVEENGRPQKIEVFEEVNSDTQVLHHAPRAQNVFSNQLQGDESPKSLNIIALDLLNTAFEDQASARTGLIDFLSKTVQPNTLISLLVIRQNGIRIAHDFTRDPRLLIAALRKIKGEVPTLGVADREALDNSMVEQVAFDLNNVIAVELAAARNDTNRALSMVATSRQNQAIASTLEAFQHIAQAFAGVPGRKNLIWATGSFPFTIQTSDNELTGGVQPEFYQRTMQLLSSANIAVYPVDVRGLIPGVLGPRIASAPIISLGSIAERSKALNSAPSSNDPDVMREDTISTLRALADMTGGKAFYNNNDISGMMDRAIKDGSSYYMLGYYKDKSDSRTGWRKLRVRVRRDDAQVHARTGFFVTPASDNPASSRQMDEKVALLSPLDYTGLPLTVEWKGAEDGGPKKKVHFTLQLPPRAAFIDTASNNHLSLDFIAVATNEKGDPTANFSQTFQANLKPPAAQQIDSNGITYANALQVGPGDYNVRFVVRDNVSGRMGSVLAPLRVQ